MHCYGTTVTIMEVPEDGVENPVGCVTIDSVADWPEAIGWKVSAAVFWLLPTGMVVGLPFTVPAPVLLFVTVTGTAPNPPRMACAFSGERSVASRATAITLSDESAWLAEDWKSLPIPFGPESTIPEGARVTVLVAVAYPVAVAVICCVRAVVDARPCM